jgi:hypothetical protein
VPVEFQQSEGVQERFVRAVAALMPPVNGRILARLIPNARLQMIDDGHLFMVTRPVETAIMIEAFSRDPISNQCCDRPDLMSVNRGSNESDY